MTQQSDAMMADDAETSHLHRDDCGGSRQACETMTVKQRYAVEANFYVNRFYWQQNAALLVADQITCLPGLQNTFTHHSLWYKHLFNGLFFQDNLRKSIPRGLTILDFTEAKTMGWQWHQVNHMQIWVVCTSQNTDTYASTSSVITDFFLQNRCSSCYPTNSIKALKAFYISAWQLPNHQQLLRNCISLSLIAHPICSILYKPTDLWSEVLSQSWRCCYECTILQRTYFLNQPYSSTNDFGNILH